MSRKAGAYGPYGTPAEFKTTTKRIVASIKNGNRHDVAAAYGGIDRDTMKVWLKRGADEIHRRLRPKYVPQEVEQPFVDFHKAVQNAVNIAEARFVQIINNSAEGIPAKFTDETMPDGSTKRTVHEYLIPPNWTAAAWWLERTRPQHYGRRDHVVIGGDEDAPLKIKLTWGTPIPPKPVRK